MDFITETKPNSVPGHTKIFRTATFDVDNAYQALQQSIKKFATAEKNIFTGFLVQVGLEIFAL